MAEKQKCSWCEAGKDAAKRKAAVIENPDLRHVYAAATDIWNHLTPEERAAALAPKTQPNPK